MEDTSAPAPTMKACDENVRTRAATPESPSLPLAPGGGSMGTVATGADGGEGDEARAALRRKRRLEVDLGKLSRQRGAILAPSRTGEGFTLTAGSQQSCMTDALENGMKLDGFDATMISTARMRSVAIPKLGNVLQATWASISVSAPT